VIAGINSSNTHLSFTILHSHDLVALIIHLIVDKMEYSFVPNDEALFDTPQASNSFAFATNNVGSTPIYVTLEAFEKWLEAASADFDSTQHDYSLADLDHDLESIDGPSSVANFQYPVPIDFIVAVPGPVQNLGSTSMFNEEYNVVPSNIMPQLAMDTRIDGPTYVRPGQSLNQVDWKSTSVPVQHHILHDTFHGNLYDSPHSEILDAGNEARDDPVLISGGHITTHGLDAAASINDSTQQNNDDQTSVEHSCGFRSIGLASEESQRLHLRDDTSTKSISASSTPLPQPEGDLHV
jgi:hypothetical protein